MLARVVVGEREREECVRGEFMILQLWPICDTIHNATPLNLARLDLTATALTVELDGRPVKTPNGNLLLIPRSSATLAHLVAAEWHAQERRLKPHALVLTSLVVRAIDDFGMDVGADASASTSTSAGSNAASTTSSNATSTSEKDQVVAPSLDAAAIVRNAAAASSRASAITFLMRYLDTDTILYHSTRPDNLVALQHQHWQPLLHWVREEFGVELKTTEGILGVRQTEEVKRVLTEVVEKMDALTLAGRLLYQCVSVLR